jgi:two-component system, OmpR family, sensor histidine kinase TctE
VSSSISRQLVIWLAVPLMLLALGGALAHYLNNVAPGVIERDRRLKEAANALMSRLQIADGKATLDTAQDGKPRLPAPDSIKYAARDRDGRLLFGDPDLPSVPLTESNDQAFALMQLEHRSARALVTRFDTTAGVLMLVVVDVRPATEPAARFGLMSTLLWDFVQLDITLVLVWVGIQFGLRPVKRLREEIARRSAQDLKPIDEATVPRELAPVVVTLNRLFSMLRTSVQAQQQFIANTAHQLRTPITGILAQLDLLAAEPSAAPVAGRLAMLKESVRQLSHSANQLLSLARADPAVNIAARNKTIALDAIAREVVAKFIDRAIRSNIDLGVEAHPIPILADPSLLDDLISNLVDNALKYTPAGGTVTVSAGEQAGKAFIAVVDTGPGIPEGERERVRQRFYRLPNSPGHGSGLGLAIVDEIARLYGASLAIGPGENGAGTRVSVQFP